jgi:hypothetical protein
MSALSHGMEYAFLVASSAVLRQPARYALMRVCCDVFGFVQNAAAVAHLTEHVNTANCTPC